MVGITQSKVINAYQCCQIELDTCTALRDNYRAAKPREHRAGISLELAAGRL